MELLGKLGCARRGGPPSALCSHCVNRRLGTRILWSQVRLVRWLSQPHFPTEHFSCIILAFAAVKQTQRRHPSSIWCSHAAQARSPRCNSAGSMVLNPEPMNFAIGLAAESAMHSERTGCGLGTRGPTGAGSTSHWRADYGRSMRALKGICLAVSYSGGDVVQM
jgi:hypothetical protein